MEGKVCIVTGANAGIGFATAKALAAKGAHVILACRDATKALAACEKITEETGNKKVDFITVNLLSLTSVREFCRQFLAKNLPLHVLVNNAGIMMGSADGWYTEDGLGSVMQVNYYAHFLITITLLDVLATTPGGARVVNLASFAHRMGYIDHHNMDGAGLTGMLCYGQSKLAMAVFTNELARRLRAAKITSVTVNSADPGPVWSSFYDPLPWAIRTAFRPFLPLMSSSEIGAKTTVFLASSQEVQGRSGGYYENSTETKCSSASADEELGAALWAATVTRTHANTKLIKME
eukprot:Opistho-2@16698